MAHERRSIRRKRRLNVCKNAKFSTGDFDPECTDDDLYQAPARKKVRQEISIWRLRKESECFTWDEDHNYPKPEDTSASVTKNLAENEAAGKTPKSTRDLETIKVQETTAEEERKSSLRSKNIPKCTSKNAVMARLNRERKKQYISRLESENESLQKKNDESLSKISKQERLIAALQHEVLYLKSLFANSKEISEILTSLATSTGLPVSSSLQTLSSTENETSYLNQVESKMSPKQERLHPKVKTVTSGSNFPILQKDVNLGCSENLDDITDVEALDIADFGSSFSFESSDIVEGNILNEHEIEAGLSVFGIPLESIYGNECEDECLGYSNEKLPMLNNTPEYNNLNSDFGLCLHVNNKKISVELCALCNGKAQVQA